MSWFSSLFGSTTKSTQQSQLPDNLQKLVDQIIAKSQGQLQKKYTPYTGDRVADPTKANAYMNTGMGTVNSAIMSSQGNPYEAMANRLMQASTKPQAAAAPAFAKPTYMGGPPPSGPAQPMPSPISVPGQRPPNGAMDLPPGTMTGKL